MMNQRINPKEAENAISQLIDILEREGYEVQKNTHTLVSITKKYIRNNPFKSMGVAMLVGVVLGWLWRY